MNKKIISLGGAILLIIVMDSILFFQKKQSTTPSEFGTEVAEQKTIDSGVLLSEPENINSTDFKSTLGKAKKIKVFSISSSTQISSFCPVCEEERVDPIEGQYWDFSVSKDHKHYAYMAYETGKNFVILDGKAQKSYDQIYFLKFSPDGKFFSYHAFDETRGETYLVLNNREISVYPESEGYPHAANGVSETYSEDGQFAYAKVTKEEPRKMEIYKNDQLINKVEGELINLWFSKGGRHLEYVVLNSAPEGGDSYYVDGELKKSDAEYNDFIDLQNRLIVGDKEIIISYPDKSIYANNVKIANYEDKNPEVYPTSLVASSLGNEVAYKVWTNETPKKQFVSINGNDSTEIFNDIRDIRFSEDGKSLSYIGRVGRNVYFVTHPVLPPK